MPGRNEFGSTVSLTNLLTVSQLGCEQKKLLGFGGLCRAPLTSNFSQGVWVTPPVRVYGCEDCATLLAPALVVRALVRGPFPPVPLVRLVSNHPNTTYPTVYQL